jgi:hypothetical protein
MVTDGAVCGEAGVEVGARQRLNRTAVKVVETDYGRDKSEVTVIMIIVIVVMTVAVLDERDLWASIKRC